MIEAVEETVKRNHRASKPEPVVVTELRVIFINLWSYSLYTREHRGQHCKNTAVITSKESIKKDYARLRIYRLGFNTDCVFYSLTVSCWRLTLVIGRRRCTWSDNKVRELATVCLPWQHWKKALVWFDDVDISAFQSCVVVDLRQSLSEWHLLLSACVLVCRRENVGAWIRAANEH